VIHTTKYEYTNPAALSLNDVCLVVRNTRFQTVSQHAFVTEPKDDYHRDRVDFFGNHWRLYAFEKPHRHLRITSRNWVDVAPHHGPDGVTEGWEPFVPPSPFVRWNAEFAAYARLSFPAGGDVQQGLLELNQRLFRDFEYDPKATEISTPVEEFFAQRKGVCQDFSHLMVALLRSVGIPARYVSGYLNTVPPPGKEKVVGADASHAWVSAYVEGAGWLDLDPTNGVAVNENHIVVAWGRDYGDVMPLKGVVLGGGTQKLDVEVTVLGETGPRASE
jgi:transglutaminase-like putative cysteine protease